MSREYVIDGGGGDQFEHWSLTGYAESNTHGGRLYYTWISEALKLYSAPEKATADLVATGTGTTVGASITLASANSSGLSGSVRWRANKSGNITAGTLFVTYCFQTDMTRLAKAIGSLLPAGSSNHEAAIELAKYDVDKAVRRQWGALLKEDPLTGRPDWRGFRDLRTELVDAQTYRALYWAYRHKAGRAGLEDDLYTHAEDWNRQYREEMRDLSLQIDRDEDKITDREPVRPVRWRRG